ncbi:uncharacterized protein A1O9_00829 [Exophiala aquamarina CBS 119918]|uniref:Uncharacterized protein n=1 Tax=Exophiala aquamarina CBS 119918 TaxID=1182545 RepID=A0A072PSM0_9EURO|nr:uncharacterized protein A1O9_00829 [Exophiala aquamarina CBS 119918]KEF62856.1 hypothetical protein A1O9_00829 [Exophiala aquamarina CBS 119918]
MVLAKPYGEWNFYDDAKSITSSVGTIAMDPEVLDSIIQGRTSNVRQLLHDGMLRDGITSTGRSVLHLAAAHGQYSIVWLLLQSKFDVSLEAIDSTCLKWTALHFASAAGHASTIDLLLKAGARQPSDEPTPLFLAVEKGHCEGVEILLAAEHGLDFGSSAPPPKPLSIAVEKDYAEIMRSFLVAPESQSPPASLNSSKKHLVNRSSKRYEFFDQIVRDATTWNAKLSIQAIFQWASRPNIRATLTSTLFGNWSDTITDWISIACQKENTTLALLHASAPFLENPPHLSVRAWTAIAKLKNAGALKEKALLGSAERIENGLEAAAEVGDLDFFSQVVEKASVLPAIIWTRACSCGNLDILLALLNRGDEPPPRILEAAAKEGQYKVISTLLLQFHRFFSTQEKDKALFAAVRAGHRKCVQALFKHRLPEPELVSRLLVSAADAGCVQVVDFFLNESTGETLSIDALTEALVAAVSNSHASTVDRLLIRHSPTCALTSYGNNLLHLAALVGSTEIAQKCLSLGIDVNTIGSLDQTALFKACDKHHWECAKLLHSHGGVLKSRVGYNSVLERQLRSELSRSAQLTSATASDDPRTRGDDLFPI